MRENLRNLKTNL